MGVATRANPYRLTLDSSFSAGRVYQLPSGRAAVHDSPNAASTGERVTVYQSGPYVVPKAALQILDGDPLWWDWANERATPLPPLTAGRSFFLGCAIGDAASGDASCTVELNASPHYLIDASRDGGETAIVGGASLFSRGGTLVGAFSTATEAQKADWLSRKSFGLESGWILEAWLTVVTNADAAVADVDVAVASATHASDLEAVAEFVSFNLAIGADLNIRVHSDDGVTDVGPTDTLQDFSLGVPVHLKLDGRNPEDVAAYVNCVRVLDSSTFTLGAATGPLRALFLMEKGSDDSPGRIELDNFTIRTSEQRG